MISAVAAQSFEAVVTGADPGLVGTITVEVYDPTNGATLVAPTLVGITEPRPGTYRVVLTAPASGTYMVRWSYGANVAEEELVVTAAYAAPVTGTIPPVDPALVRPTVAEVSVLERTRTTGQVSSGLGGDTSVSDVTVFNADTRPTATEVEALIDQASSAIIGQLPVEVPVVYYGQIRHFIALYTAVLIEGSFFRESLDEGSVELYRDLLSTGLPALSTAITDEVADETGAGFASLPVVSATVRNAYPLFPEVA